MNLLLAALMLQVLSTGDVTGIVRGPNGEAAANVRVFAIALRDVSAATGDATVLETLAMTDESGHYRLQVPPGKYYIASGSVDQPTFYPNTTTRMDARPITVASGDHVDGIDFSSFVAPRRAPLDTFSGLVFLPTISAPRPSGSLSGTVRFSDGTPAQGIAVIAIPVPRNSRAVSPRNIPSLAVVRTQTDVNGRYRLTTVGDYYLAAGALNAFSIYPGTSDIDKAASLSVMNSQIIDNLDFVLPGIAVQGRVLVAGEAPGAGASIRILSNEVMPADLTGVAGFFPKRTLWEAAVDSAGSFSLPGLPPGRYLVEASAESAPLQSKEIVVESRPVTGVDFKLPIASLMGTITMRDGKPMSDPLVLGSVVISAVDPESLTSTLFNVTSAGTFGGILDPGEYRITMPSIPLDYALISIKVAGRDVLNETFKITDSESLRIAVQIESLSH
jgi:hypothetical protein